MSDQTVKLEEKLPPGRDASVLAQSASAAPSAAIPLGDLRTGPEAVIQRLEFRLASLTEELGKKCDRNDQLAAANRRLDAELREAKLLLSKVQMSELRVFEKSLSWLRR